mgnify:CR=1 FL=1
MRHRFPKIHLKSRNTIADTKLVVLNRYLKIDIVDLQRNKKDFLPKGKFRTCCPHMLPTKDLDYLEKENSIEAY